MTVYLVTLYFFTAIAGLSAIGVLLSRNVFYAALLLIICLLSVAALYVVLFAEFVAVTQILVYAGGILVVIIFGIMLTVRFGDLPLRVRHANIFSGILISISLLVIMSGLFSEFSLPIGPSSPLDQHPAPIEAVGVSFLTDHILVFEVSGLLLLIALIGAAVIASHKPDNAR